MTKGVLSHRLKTLEREQARLLWTKLDECIPGRFKRKRVRSSAGSRSLGAHGRTSLDIVLDAISFAKQIRECPSADGSAAAQSACRDASSSESVAESKAGLERKGAEGPATEARPHSAGLMSARGLFCVEVEMQEPLHPLVHREWVIVRVGRGAEDLWVRSPSHSLHWCARAFARTSWSCRLILLLLHLLPPPARWRCVICLPRDHHSGTHRGVPRAWISVSSTLSTMTTRPC